MFDHLAIAPPDSILGLNEAFLADNRSPKVNLTVGVYKNEQLQTPTLNTVKQAEKLLIEAEATKSYLGMDGLKDFTSSIADLVFGDSIERNCLSVVQTPGGTGALRVGAEMLATNFPGQRIFVSRPTWANHRAIFSAAGLELQDYDYLASGTPALDFDAMIRSIEESARPGDAVCLHACCHNPTGVDPTPEQWEQIGDLISKRQLLPFFDFAYLGFGQGLTEDRAGLLSVLSKVKEAIVCVSCSKNFGLYSERVGAVAFVSKPEAAAAVMSQLKMTVRCNYSNPPRHGGSVVATILNSPELRQTWQDELDAMRSRIQEMRKLFLAGLKSACSDRDFGFLGNQNGMFSFTGLNPMQVDWLKNEKAIYIVGTGRVNVAGMSKETMPYLCDSIAECLSQV